MPDGPILVPGVARSVLTWQVIIPVAIGRRLQIALVSPCDANRSRPKAVSVKPLIMIWPVRPLLHRPAGTVAAKPSRRFLSLLTTERAFKVSMEGFTLSMTLEASNVHVVGSSNVVTPNTTVFTVALWQEMGVLMPFVGLEPRRWLVGVAVFQLWRRAQTEG